MDTSSFEQYLQAIAACDVIVLNHPANGYEYRASGLIADAAAAQVPVVVRNLPLLRHQVLHPEAIGECFEKGAEIPECIGRVSDRLARKEYDFETYNKARSAEALAQQLDELCKAM